MLAAAVAVVLIGFAAMLLIAGRVVENRLDDRIATVNRDFDASLNRFRADVHKELDSRLPAAGAGAFPTPTPLPSATPTATTTPDAGTTATATASPTATATSQASPTATPPDGIRP